jgi:hypothetical protein
MEDGRGGASSVFRPSWSVFYRPLNWGLRFSTNALGPS